MTAMIKVKRSSIHANTRGRRCHHLSLNWKGKWCFVLDTATVLDQKDMSNYLEVKCKICNIIFNWHVIYPMANNLQQHFEDRPPFADCRQRHKHKGQKSDTGFGETLMRWLCPVLTFHLKDNGDSRKKFECLEGCKVERLFGGVTICTWSKKERILEFHSACGQLWTWRRRSIGGTLWSIGYV